MKLLLILLSLIAGLSVRYHILINVVLFSFIIFYSWKNYSNRWLIILFITFLLGVGISFLTFNFTSESYSGIVIESKKNYFIVFSRFEKIYVYNKNNTYEIGDILTITGKKETYHFSVIESGFDFNTYLAKKGIYHQLSNPDIKAIFMWPIRLKQIKSEFLSHFNNETQSLISSILFGENDRSTLNSTIANLHLSRLLSAGGIYLSVFLKLLETILSKFFQEKGVKRVSLIFLIFYSIFTFPRLTIIRFFLLRLLLFINQYYLKEKYDYLTILACSGLILLFFDYHFVYQDSFIITYSISILLVILRSNFVMKKGIIGKLHLAILLSIFLIPFELSYYHEISLLSPLLTFISTPLFLIYAFLGILCFCRIPLYNLMNHLTEGIKNTMNIMSKISLEISAPALNDLLVVLFYLFFFFFLYFCSIKFKPLIKITTSFFLTCFAGYFLPLNNLVTSEINFINVGQGDSCLIRLGMNTILIDTGGSTYQDIALDCLIPYFHSKRLYQIDLVITTHDDFDHKGALESLQNNFKVKKYISDYQSFPYTYGGLKITNYNIYPSLWEEENDRSLVLGFTFKNQQYLLMGDAPTKIEKKIIADNPALKADILKIGHHGSNTSTCEQFITAIKPKEAIISVGKNLYGHPNQKVLNILSSHQVIIKRTDLLGTITY